MLASGPNIDAKVRASCQDPAGRGEGEKGEGVGGVGLQSFLPLASSCAEGGSERSQCGGGQGRGDGAPLSEGLLQEVFSCIDSRRFRGTYLTMSAPSDEWPTRHGNSPMTPWSAGTNAWYLRVRSQVHGFGDLLLSKSTSADTRRG